MPKIISEETKQQAFNLRQQGMSYKEISEVLPVSANWCKLHLKEQKKASTLLYKSLLEKSKEPHGISKGEIAKALDLNTKPEAEAVVLLNNTTARIRKESTDNVVRQDWMHPRMAKALDSLIMQEVLAVDDRLTEQALNILVTMTKACETEDDKKNLPSVNQIKNAIIGFVAGISSTRRNGTSRLKNWIESVRNTADKLSERNEQLQLDTLFAHDYEDEIFSEMEDLMY